MSDDGMNRDAYVVMAEGRHELAYRGVHTQEGARSLAGGFDDVEVRHAEDVIRELCGEVKRLGATAAPGDLAALAARIEESLERHGTHVRELLEPHHGPSGVRQFRTSLNDELGEVPALLRAHRCAPAVEVATEDVAPMSPDDECTCGHDYATHVVNDGACLHAKVCACAGFDLAPSTPAAPPAEGEEQGR